MIMLELYHQRHGGEVATNLELSAAAAAASVGDAGGLRNLSPVADERDTNAAGDEDDSVSGGGGGVEAHKWKKYSHKRLSHGLKRVYFHCAYKTVTGCPAKKVEDRCLGKPRRSKKKPIPCSSSSESQSLGASGDDDCGEDEPPAPAQPPGATKGPLTPRIIEEFISSWQRT